MQVLVNSAQSHLRTLANALTVPSQKSLQPYSLYFTVCLLHLLTAVLIIIILSQIHKKLLKNLQVPLDLKKETDKDVLILLLEQTKLLKSHLIQFHITLQSNLDYLDFSIIRTIRLSVLFSLVPFFHKYQLVVILKT